MFVAGPYNANYNSASLGVTQDGWELEYTFAGDPITGDNLGDSVQDHVYRGGNVFWSSVLQEWNLSSVKLAYWPFHTIFGRVAEVGCNVLIASSGMAAGLVLSVPAGSACRAASAGPTTITVRHAIHAIGTPIRQLFAARLRQVPIRFQAYPYVDGQAVTTPPAPNSAAVWFTAV